jgi:hypothetical protein
MSELDLSGWELEDLPEDAEVIADQWLEQFANGDPLSGDRISYLIDRALIHAQILTDL